MKRTGIAVMACAAAVFLAGPLRADEGAKGLVTSHWAASLDPFKRGLVADMRDSAAGLKDDRRASAMAALNRARHLALATTTVGSLDQQTAQAFRQAHDAIKKARALVQDGRPERAAEVLGQAASGLEKAPTGQPAAFGAADVLSGALGQTAVNARGESLGTLNALRADKDHLVADLRVGGVLGLGAKTISLDAEQVLLGRPYVALATEARATDLRRKSSRRGSP
ncbi:hypothetical protein SLNSH_21260 [Alsobacter soli]|uniref:PRC-barrel domain-containing protein n=1 Tax=Alsobacter soli TaxID=2109933 RepID=A0A2T1HMR7_9HYPH|nr:hypothetical protein [Alsobacter soli]PSC02922.1 hypothetical protein SLNSH_21260 [Alsobacter soli]